MDVTLENKEQQEDVQEHEKRRGKRREDLKEEQTSQPVRKKSGIGCDIGTMTVVSARQGQEGIQYKVERDAFFGVENNMMSRAMLNKLNANFVESEDKRKLYIVGEESLEMANFFNQEIQRPLCQGVISTREKEALAIIKIILKSIVGDPQEENEICHFSVPASPIDADYNIIYHQNILKSFLTSFGFKAIPFNEAAAVGFSELEDDDFSGLALSFGAGMVNVAFLMLGVAQDDQQFSISRSGDWIDTNASMACGIKASRITSIKEAGVDILNPKNREETAIKIYYENLIEYTCNAIEKKVNSSSTLNFKKPIPVIISGGTSKIINFEKVFEKELRSKILPFEISEVRKAKDQLKAVARGCLLASINAQ
jgi:hypothetical protein